MKISQAGRITVGSGNAESKFQVIGDTSILYGSWVRVAEYWSGHATQMKCGLIMYNEAGGTNDHGVGFGTYTNDPISWFVNGSTGMVFNTSKRLSVNKTAGPKATIHAGGMIWADEQFHSKQNVDGKAVYRTNWSQANYLAMGTDATVGAMRLGVCDSVFNWVSYAPVRGGAYTNASDRRIKNDIIDIPYGLDQVMAMKPKKFSLRSDNSTHVGFIAQEIVEVIPECVSGSESADDELNENGEPINPMGIDLASLVSVLCKAIQELKAEVNELRAIIAE
ncbi:hypothetical protein V7S43_017258 [Phytophthora oleae]|uniref:Peptidase S74 domain-containing protein n=1 Tax=Phytophthora oleae TaxID=2107226 RepID=A0ABD3EXU4_9STRA